MKILCDLKAGIWGPHMDTSSSPNLRSNYKSLVNSEGDQSELVMNSPNFDLHATELSMRSTDFQPFPPAQNLQSKKS